VEGFVFFACIIVVFVWFMRRLRLKEVESFLDSAFDDPLELSEPAPGEAPVDPLLARAHAYLEKDYPKAGVVALPAADAPAVGARKHKVRGRILPEHYRLVLKVLRKDLSESHGILINIPWSDFVAGEDDDLRRHSISFLVCDQNYHQVVAGIDFVFDDEKANESSRKQTLLRSLFEDICKPLILFVDSDKLSEDEIHEGLSVIQKKQPADHWCPKCGEKMRIRKATRGKNDGKEFWVCKSFPGCKGMARI